MMEKPDIVKIEDELEWLEQNKGKLIDKTYSFELVDYDDDDDSEKAKKNKENRNAYIDAMKFYSEYAERFSWCFDEIENIVDRKKIPFYKRLYKCRLALLPLILRIRERQDTQNLSDEEVDEFSNCEDFLDETIEEIFVAIRNSLFSCFDGYFFYDNLPQILEYLEGESGVTLNTIEKIAERFAILHRKASENMLSELNTLLQAWNDKNRLLPNPKNDIDKSVKKLIIKKNRESISRSIRCLWGYVKGDYDRAFCYFSEILGLVDDETPKSVKCEIGTMYIDTCLLKKNPNKKEALRIIKEYDLFNCLDDEESKKNQQVRLFEYYLANKNDDGLLTYFFSASKDEVYQAFSKLIKYSNSLDFEPFDLVEPFCKSNMIECDNRFISDTKNFSEEEKTKLKEIWFWEKLIMAQLYLNDDSNISEISHYTSIDTFDILISKTGKKYGEKYNPLRKTSLTTANDPTEGKVLSKILKENGISWDSQASDGKTKAFQTSFTRLKDSLTMFRLYGKKEKKEGTGVSLVFKSDFFLTNFSLIPVGEIIRSIAAKNGKNQIDKNNVVEKTREEREPIAWVLYYNDERNLLYFYPNEDELIPTEINLNNRNPEWKDGNPSDRLEYSFAKLIAALKAIESKSMQKVAVEILHRLRYLIKTSDFAEEKELRLLEIKGISEKGVKEDGNSVFTEYTDIWSENVLKEIIFGPKAVEKSRFEVYEKKILSKHKNLKLKISDAPFA